MRVIDADTHVDETEESWAHLTPDEQDLRPTTAYPPNPDPDRPPGSVVK